MTGATIAVPLSSDKMWESGDTAVGDESEEIRNEAINSEEHYLKPFSRLWANHEMKFLILKAKWEQETAILSSAREKAMHPAYQEIIGMGEAIVPLILSEMKQNPKHWFWALKSITGENPILPEQRGIMNEMTRAWLEWGNNKGYMCD